MGNRVVGGALLIGAGIGAWYLYKNKDQYFKGMSAGAVPNRESGSTMWQARYQVGDAEYDKMRQRAWMERIRQTAHEPVIYEEVKASGMTGAYAMSLANAIRAKSSPTKILRYDSTSMGLPR